MSTEADEESRRITVCFTGHRQLENERLPVFVVRLDSVLEKLYQMGYRRFISGGALGFDTLAAERVTHLQLTHPDVKLIIVVPCGDQARRWRAEDCRRYERMLYNADQTIVLSPAYYDGCMMVRNRYMVDHAGFCLCCLYKLKGGTVSTVTYAIREKLSLLNLAMEDACDAFVRRNDEAGGQLSEKASPCTP